MEICLNRPFKFVLINIRTNDILFLGSINKLEGENVIDDVTSIFDEQNEGKVIYDIYGRRRSSASTPGVYIIDGKKKIVK